MAARAESDAMQDDSRWPELLPLEGGASSGNFRIGLPLQHAWVHLEDVAQLGLLAVKMSFRKGHMPAGVYCDGSTWWCLKSDV